MVLQSASLSTLLSVHTSGSMLREHRILLQISASRLLSFASLLKSALSRSILSQKHSIIPINSSSINSAVLESVLLVRQITNSQVVQVCNFSTILGL